MGPAGSSKEVQKASILNMLPCWKQVSFLLLRAGRGTRMVDK